MNTIDHEIWETHFKIVYAGQLAETTADDKEGEINSSIVNNEDTNITLEDVGAYIRMFKN